MRKTLLAFATLAALAQPALAGDFSAKEFGRTMAVADSHMRHKAILALDGNDKKQLKMLYRVLEGKSGPYCDFHDRDAAIKALAKVANSKAIEDMAKKLKKHKNYLMRQALCTAFVKMNDDAYYEHIFTALGDKDPRVRREAAHALRIHRKKSSITALINQWVKEKDPLAATFMRSSLEDITRRYQGPRPRAWQAWWMNNQDDFVLGSTDEEAERLAEEEGRKMKKHETRTRDAKLNSESRGQGYPLLVIPPYGYSKEIITPFLTVLEQTNKIYYIDLPKVDSFQNLRTLAGHNYYPINKLVGAFEQLRKETKEERFAVMAWGMNSWVALRYAQKFPKSVSHLVLVAPISGNTEYGKASARFISQGKGSGDLEKWHFGLTRSFNSQTGKGSHEIYHEENKIAKPEGEGGGIDRRSWGMMFANPKDSLVSLLYPVKDRHLGGVAIPDFEARKEPKTRVPMLCIVGKQSQYTSVGDVQGIAKLYGGICRVYKNSSCMPHAEESRQFNKDLQMFLKPSKGAVKAAAKRNKKKKK